MDTWARDTVRWYWSADTLFWQLSIDDNIDVQSAFSWAPKVARKCESKHWYACGADGRSVGRSRDQQIFLEWVDLFTHGAPLAHFARGAPLSICKRFAKASHWCEGKMCGLSLLAIFTFWLLYSKQESSISRWEQNISASKGDATLLGTFLFSL